MFLRASAEGGGGGLRWRGWGCGFAIAAPLVVRVGEADADGMTEEAEQQVLRCAQDDKQKGQRERIIVAFVLLSLRCWRSRDSSVGGEQEGLCAGAVGAEGVRVGGFEAGEDLRAGVAEGVVAADADDGGLRGNGGEEGRVGGGAAAVVADLEQRNGGEAVLCEHGGFAGGFGVAFEQDAGAAVVEAQDERVVVDGGAGVGVAGLRGRARSRRDRPRGSGRRRGGGGRGCGGRRPRRERRAGRVSRRGRWRARARAGGSRAGWRAGRPCGRSARG